MNTTSAFATICSVPTSGGSKTFAIGIRCDDEQITAIEYLAPCNTQPPRTALSKEALRQVRAWLHDPHFAFSLPLAPAGTHFQRRVWDAIASISPGTTCSYSDIAVQLGSGPRAVGNACGANPYPLIVPCHRVISANQGLGGFARSRGGFLLDVKRWLLQHERR